MDRCGTCKWLATFSLVNPSTFIRSNIRFGTASARKTTGSDEARRHYAALIARKSHTGATRHHSNSWGASGRTVNAQLVHCLHKLLVHLH